MPFPQLHRRQPLAPGRLRLSLLAAGISSLAAMGTLPAARAGVLIETVRSLCLSAFHQEMNRAGKVPPAGMADFACACVTEQLVGGSSLDTARQSCRLATTRRYPL